MGMPAPTHERSTRDRLSALGSNIPWHDWAGGMLLRLVNTSQIPAPTIRIIDAHDLIAEWETETVYARVSFTPPSKPAPGSLHIAINYGARGTKGEVRRCCFANDASAFQAAAELLHHYLC